MALAKKALALGIGILAGLVVLLLPLAIIQPAPLTRFSSGVLNDSTMTIHPWTDRPVEVFGLTSASFTTAFLTYIASRRLMRRGTPRKAD